MGGRGTRVIAATACARLLCSRRSHAREAADDYLHDFYAFLGPYADQIAAAALVTPDAITGAVSEFTEAGCDELILFPCNPDPAQVDLLADALGT